MPLVLEPTMRHATRSKPLRAFTLGVVAALGFAAAPVHAIVPALTVWSPTGTQPIALTHGDLNGDGADDVVTANYLSHTVSVLISTGRFGFLPKTDFATPNNPADVELGDFNGDGRLDLAVGCTSGQLSIRMGNGNGGFGPRTDIASGGGPRGLAIGDLNLDGRADIAAANFAANSVSVFLGNGVGGFAPRIDTAVPGGPHGIAIGDMFGDGIPDLFTANYNASTVSVYLGIGDGTVFHWITSPVENGPMAVALADLDQDGDPEVMTANNGANSITVLPVVAPGFGTPTHLAVGLGPADLAAHVSLDFGLTNVFVANFASSSVSVLKFDASGAQLGIAQSYNTGFDPSGIAVFDADANGTLDVATVSQGIGRVTLFRILGVEFQNPPSFVPSEPPSSGNPELADLDNDGHLDLVVPELGAVRIWRGQGNGAFTFASEAPTIGNPNRIALRDLDHDGDQDMVVSTSTSLTGVFLNLGDGTFGPRADISHPGQSAYGLAIADVTLDGHPDLILCLPYADTVRVYAGDGAGGFSFLADLSAGSLPFNVVVGRFDADPYPDLVVGRGGSATGVALLRGWGGGTFLPAVFFTAGTGPAYVALGDVNADGTLDIVSANVSPDYTVLLNNGAGGISSTTYINDAQATGVRLADIDGDGRLDIIGSDGVRLGDGTGFFHKRTGFTPNGSGIAIGDLDHDGSTDVVVGGTYGDPLTKSYVGRHRARVALDADPLTLDGEAITLTAHVTSELGTPTGTVKFLDGLRVLGTEPVLNGTASLALFAEALGDRCLSAVYLPDYRWTAAFSQVVTQRVVASPQPDVATIADVKNDQGRSVRLRFTASAFDYGDSPTPITSYGIYRKVNSALAMIAARGGETAPPRAAAATAATPLPDELAIAGWDYVQSVPAHGESVYETVVPTLADSNDTGFHRATFFVRAQTATPSVFYDSAPDSGYSVDNLAPAPPALFTAAYAAGATHLHWSVSPEPDFGYFALHRGTTSSFTPGPGTLVATPVDTGHVDVGPAGRWYKLAAVDVNGNVSGYALLGPGGTLGVPGAESIELALMGPRPNPARAGRFTVSFALPSGVPAKLELMDIGGRRVRSREVGGFGPGLHAIDLSVGEPLPAGIYLLRLTQGSAARSMRMTLLP